MIAVLIKGILFYFLFVFIRNVFMGYKTYQQVKNGMGQGHGPFQNTGPKQRYKSSNDDVLEAEYRVIKD